MNSPDWLFKRRSFAADLIQTSVANFTVLVCTVLTYGLAARIFNDDVEFGAYGTFRRLVVGVRPVIGIGLALALTRYLPLHATRGWVGRWRLLWLTTGIMLSIATVVAALMLVFPDAVSFAVLGDSQYADWIPGLLAITVGTLLHSQAVSYFRGRLLVDIANLITVLNLGMIPLTSLYIVNRPDLSAVLLVAGAGLSLVSGSFLVLAVFDSRSRSRQPADPEPMPSIRKSYVELMSYGLPRVPGFIAMSVMWVVSPILVNQMGGLAQSIYIVMGMQMLSIAANPVRPLATVFLPRFAEMKAEGKFEEMNSIVRMMGAMLIQLGVFIAVQLVVFMPVLLKVWLERGGTDAILPVSIIALSIPAFLLYETLRNTIESYSAKPLIAYVAMVALAFLLLSSLLLWVCGVSAVLSVAIGTSLAFYLSGFLVFRLAGKLYNSKSKVKVCTGNLLGILLALAIGLPASGLAILISASSTWLVIISIGIFEIIALASYLFILHRSGIDWIRELLNRVRQKQTTPRQSCVK